MRGDSRAEVIPIVQIRVKKVGKKAKEEGDKLVKRPKGEKKGKRR